MKKNKPFIIITGGTRGLGLATAKYLSKLQWNLIIIDISIIKLYSRQKW